MPWKSSDARRHTKRAKSPKRKRQWSKVANRVLQDTGDEGRAVRIANAAVKKAGSGKSSERRKTRMARKKHRGGKRKGGRKSKR